MEIENREVLILGGSGLVGVAVARELIAHAPARIVVCGLTRADADPAVAALMAERLKDRSREEILADPTARASLLDDLFGELTEQVVTRSALGALLLRRRPDIVIDCVSTATAFAYQNVFESAASLRRAASETAGSGAGASLEAVERHLATLYMPQLIRHVQIALDAMRRAGTSLYLKIGTAGTGGMGLNIPFTHSEERPSRTLLAKSGVAGAQTLLLYLMARTPGAPAVKEIKPTAAISWKRIGYGEVRRRDGPIRVYDATTPVSLERVVEDAGDPPWRETGDTLRGVFLDAGENGLFSAYEFETLTALGLMEFITPEEIAADSVREIIGHPTGKDVVAALDAATAGPTYRAGVMRGAVLERMSILEAECGGRAVAYEMLGPPRLSKLLFEAELLARLFADLRAVAALDSDATAAAAAAWIEAEPDLRTRILSIGLPILLPDGRHVLRGPQIRVVPAEGQAADDPRVIDNGWVDLRPANWRKWCDRARAIVEAVEREPGPDAGSRSDIAPEHRRLEVRPGALVAWIFRYEDRGERMKR